MEASLNISKGNLTSFLLGWAPTAASATRLPKGLRRSGGCACHLPEQGAGHGADWPLSPRGGTYLILRRHRGWRRTDTSSVPFVLTRNQALVQLIQSSQQPERWTLLPSPFHRCGG